MFSREELKALHRRRPLQVLVRLFVLVALWAGLAIAAHGSSLAAKVPLWITMGFVLNGLIQLWHDSWHGTAFKSRAANAVFGSVLAAIFFNLNAPQRHAHLLHHKHNRTPLDPDAYNVGKRSANMYLQFYGVVLVGLALSPLHYSFAYPMRFYDVVQRRRHFVQLFVLVSLYAALAAAITALDVWSLVIDAWLVPFLFTSPWMGLKSIADHHANVWRGTDFETATTTKSNALVTFLWNGLNFHLEHHLYPQVPGYALPRIHARMAEILDAGGAPIFTSYTQVMSAAFVSGPRFIDEDTIFTHPELHAT